MSYPPLSFLTLACLAPFIIVPPSKMYAKDNPGPNKSFSANLFIAGLFLLISKISSSIKSTQDAILIVQDLFKVHV